MWYTHTRNAVVTRYSNYVTLILPRDSRYTGHVYGHVIYTVIIQYN